MRPASTTPGEPPVCFAAMLQPERMLQQSSRPLDPVEPLKPPRQKGCIENVGSVMGFSRGAGLAPQAARERCKTHLHFAPQRDPGCYYSTKFGGHDSPISLHPKTTLLGHQRATRLTNV